MKIGSFIHPTRTYLPCSGVGRHMNNLLTAIHEMDEVALTLFYSKYHLTQEGLLPLNAPLRNIRHKVYSFPERLLERSWKAFNWPKMDDFAIEADWVFSPAETYIPLKRIPSAVTIHDVQAFEDDLPWSNTKEHKAFRQRWKFWIPKLVRNTELIFTVSDYSRDRLIEKLNLPESRVRISGNAVDIDFEKNVAATVALKKDFPFLLVIGGLRLKKGGGQRSWRWQGCSSKPGRTSNCLFAEKVKRNYYKRLMNFQI